MLVELAYNNNENICSSEMLSNVHRRRGRLDAADLLEAPQLKSARQTKREKVEFRHNAGPRNPFRKPTKRLTAADRRAIVALRYGSLTDFSRPVLRYTEIAKRLHIRSDTVSYALSRFHALGSRLENMLKGKRSYKVIPDAVKERLLSTDLLSEWAAFTIAERCEAIKRLWGVSIS